MARRKQPAAGAAPGSKHPRAIFSTTDVSVIFQLADSGWSQREIAAYMTEELLKRGRRSKAERPISKSTIGSILRGDTYSEE